MKKLTSILLTIAMLLSLIPISVSAAENNTEVTRYTVLALDTSGSMSGSPMTAAKAAAIKFCESIINANGTNYVALITLNSSSSIINNFTDDINTIKSKINNLYASGGTNVNDALEVSNSILSSLSGDNVVKNIVILSDGLPESGKTSYNGPYTSSDYYDYEYANPAYHNAQEFKKTNYIYTLGFFHSLYGSELTFGRKFMSDLQNAGYYDVTNIDELDFVFGDVADDITNKAKAGTFTYASGEEKDYQGTYYYDDNYFTKESTTYNNSLASMSLCLAISAFGSNDGGNTDYSNKFKNVKALLCDELGFEKFEKNDWFTKKPTSESIGVVAAQKKIMDENEPYTLIAVAVRGGGYESEWASNFTIGTSGQASGFANAKGQVLEFLKNYISNEENGISGKIKIWITGYSRAAATSNLVAGAIDDNLGLFGNNVTLDKTDLFAYCFETPMGALTTEKKAVEASDPTRYKNIWNIVNKNDPVTKVAMTDLGFARYGNDHYLPDKLTSEYFVQWQPIMLGYYNAMNSYEETGTYNVDDFQMKKLELKYVLPGGNSPVQNDTKNNWTQGKFLDETISKLTNEIFKSRQNYVNEFQNGIRIIFTAKYGTLFEGYSQGDAKRFIDLFIDRITNWDILGNLLWTAITNPSDVEDVIENIVTECLNECGMNNLSISTFSDFIGAVAKLIVQFAVSHPNLTTTLICNIKSMGAAHYPELCFAWLMTEDKNYTTNPVEFNGTGSYRIIRINCPIDVEVYDSEGTLVAKISDNEPEEVSGSGIVSSINEDGEKIVILPITSEYLIQMNATADGQVNYSISEFSNDVEDNNRIINYFDIDVAMGDTLKGIVPAYSNYDIENGTPDGSSVTYTLQDNENNVLQADSDLSGDNATNAYYMVTLSSNNENYGIVTGQGIRQIGNFAQLEAIPNEGCSFLGWYKNDELLSTELQYRFAVTEDISIVGKFSNSTTTKSSGGGGAASYTVKFDTNGGNTISNKSVRRNSTLAEPTTPVKDGFTFKGWYTDKELTKAYDFSTKVTKGFTLYAKWEDIKKSQIILTIGDKEALVFGETVENDVAPKIVNDRTMLPIRFIAEALGAKVDWIESSQTVKVTTDGIEIVLVIGENYATVNGKKVELDSPAFIENDRTYLPLRFVSENLGAKVEWLEETQQVIITK